MDKQIIYIGLEFLFGPIQKLEKNENGDLITGIEVIDNDEYIQKLDKETNELWCSLWKNDLISSSGVKFDNKKEKELAPKLLDLIDKLINRLKQINDGTYEIEDMITDHLKKLINE